MTNTATRARPSHDDDADDGIEMTVIKDWGRRLPDGAKEIDRDEMERERELFAQFPDDWKTSRDASTRAPITSEQERALREATDQMITRARAMKKGMEDRGEAVDLDKIDEAVFGHIPRGMIPPEWVKELQSWRRVRDAMGARAVVKGQAPEGRAEKLKSGVDKAGIAASLLQAAASAGKAVAPEKAAKVAENIGLAFELLGKALEGVGLGADTSQAADMTKEAGQSPVALKIADEKMLEALKGIAGLGLDIAGLAIPLISALMDGADCLAAVKDTVERAKLRAGTGELKDKAAVDTTDQLSRAFDQAQGRETRLAAESGVGAVTSGLSATGSAVTMSGVAAPVGLAIKVANGVITVGGKVVFAAIDERTARRAISTLRLAQAGDTDAQQAVFSDNAHYAKMLIAVMAMDDNPLAKKYLLDRGLEEDDLKNPLTTGDILFDYMVMKSKEEDAPSSKLDAAADFLESAKAKFEAFGALCEKGLVRIGALKGKPLEKPPELSAPVPSEAQIKKMWQQVNIAREALEHAQSSGGDTKAVEAQYRFAIKLTQDLQIRCESLEKATGDAAAAREKWLADNGGAPKAQRDEVQSQATKMREEETAWEKAKWEILRKGA